MSLLKRLERLEEAVHCKEEPYLSEENLRSMQEDMISSLPFLKSHAPDRIVIYMGAVGLGITQDLIDEIPPCNSPYCNCADARASRGDSIVFLPKSYVALKPKRRLEDLETI